MRRNECFCLRILWLVLVLVPVVGFVETHAAATWAKAIIFVHVRFLSPCERMLISCMYGNAFSNFSPQSCNTMNMCLSDEFPIMPFFSQHCSTKLTQLIHQYIFSSLSCKYILVGLPQHQCDRDDYHGYSLNLPNSQILKLMILSLHWVILKLVLELTPGVGVGVGVNLYPLNTRCGSTPV